jgi:hypothetical protein
MCCRLVVSFVSVLLELRKLYRERKNFVVVVVVVVGFLEPPSTTSTGFDGCFFSHATFCARVRSMFICEEA